MWQLQARHELHRRRRQQHATDCQARKEGPGKSLEGIQILHNFGFLQFQNVDPNPFNFRPLALPKKLPTNSKSALMLTKTRRCFTETAQRCRICTTTTKQGPEFHFRFLTAHGEAVFRILLRSPEL